MSTSLVVHLRQVVALSALAAAAAAADDQSSSARLEDVVVTGQKIATTLQDSPESIAVVTPEALDDQNLFDLQDVYAQVPNVASFAGNRGFSIRGINFSGVNFAGSGQTASLYVDNVVITPTFAVFDGPLGAWDVQQIEFYRGPQSTNFGRSSLIGAIVINSKDPTFDWEGAVRGTFAEDNTQRYAAAISGPIIGDELAFRISAEKYDTDGGNYNVTRDEDDWDRRDRTLVRGKLLWRPAAVDGLEVKLTLTHSDNERGSDLVVGPDFFARTSTFNAPEFEVNESDLVSLDITYRIDDRWSLRSITGYLDNEYESRQDGNRGPAGPAVSDRYRNQADDALTQELRLHYDSDRVRSVAGLYYFDAEEDEEFGVVGRVAVLQPEEQTNWAIFGEVQYDLTEKWMVTAGFRYDEEEADRSQTFDFFDGSPVTEASSADYSAFLPKLGVTYSFTPDHALSFTYQEAYRVGGSGVNAISGIPYEYDPEYTRNYELAWRSLLADGKVLFNANVFFIDWEDQQVTTIGPSDDPFDTITGNAASSELSGIEATLTWQATPGLSVFLSAGSVSTEFKSYVDVFTGESLAGNEFPYAPDFTVSGGFTYRHAAGWMAALNVSYASEAFDDAENTPEFVIEDLTLVNARAGYEGESWSAYVYAENLFDEDHINGYLSPTLARLTDPRRAGVQLEWRF